MLERILKDIQENLKDDCSEKSEVIGFTFAVFLFPHIFDLRAFCKNQKVYCCFWKNGKRSTKFMELKK